MLISVVIPTLNEVAGLSETVARARANPEVGEIIVADGGSGDGTVDLAERLECQVVRATPGRGAQLRAGAARASGEVVLLLHADTWLPADAGSAVRECLRDEGVVGGGFWKVFRNAPWFMRGSRARCGLRHWLNQPILGDQGLFVRRRILEESGGVPEVPLMEEFELCRVLRRRGRLVLAPATVSTSTRRFRQNGVLRTYWRMSWVTLRYWLGASPAELERIYNKPAKR
jgi:rSAM/selenodomain-associated transferase 2